MPASEIDPDLAAVPAEDVAADPFSDAPGEQGVPQVSELLGASHEASRSMLEADEALRSVRARFKRTGDLEVQGELAAEALGHVERQLELARERRQQLDGIEGELWSRRNRLERFLIHTRGRAWWRARRRPA